MAVIRVGTNAYFRSSIELIPFLKYFFNIDKPTGLGALAIIVSPPPVKAPDTRAYFRVSDNSGTNVLKYVKDALSLNAVKIIAVMFKANAGKLASMGLIHQD